MSKESPKLIFSLLLGIPVFVILGSTLLYFLVEREVIDLGVSTRGELITPPVQMRDVNPKDSGGEPADWFENPEAKWSMLVIDDGDCGAYCQKLIYLSRQTHVAMGKKKPRVQRILLSRGQQLSPALRDEVMEKHSDMRLLFTDSKKLAELTAKLPEAPRDSNRIYFMDPNGWIMMEYTLNTLEEAEVNQLGKDIIKDSRRLLR